MEVTKRNLLASLAVATASLLMSQAPTTAFAQDKPVSGGTLNMLMQPEPPTLMLGLNQQGPTQFDASKIYQSLLTYGKDLEPLPSLAQSWTISPDGLTYTFTRQKGVKWHDGKPLSAADVVVTADKFLREVHPRMRALMNQRVESVKAEGDDKVVFKLKQAFNPFIDAFEVSTMPIVPKHIYEGTDYRNNPANNTPIGTGPFMLKEWKRGSYIHLVKNPSYFALVNEVRRSAEHRGYSCMDVVSGAGHDAVYVASQLPVAMIFVPCKDGISHNEIEDAKPEHLEAGCNILLDAMLRAAN